MHVAVTQVVGGAGEISRRRGGAPGVGAGDLIDEFLHVKLQASIDAGAARIISLRDANGIWRRLSIVAITIGYLHNRGLAVWVDTWTSGQRARSKAMRRSLRVSNGFSQ